MVFSRTLAQRSGTSTLRHALLIDAAEDGALDILIMSQIAFDCLAQKMGARHTLLAHCHVDFFKYLAWQLKAT